MTDGPVGGVPKSSDLLYRLIQVAQELLELTRCCGRHLSHETRANFGYDWAELGIPRKIPLCCWVDELGRRFDQILCIPNRAVHVLTISEGMGQPRKLIRDTASVRRDW